MIPKQYLIIAVVLICVFSFGFGYKTGGNAIRVEYQASIDQQKAAADKIIQENIVSIEKAISENEATKQKLDNERQKNVKITNDLRIKFANNGLRFKSNQCGASGSNTMSTKSDSAIYSNSTTIELPSEITRSLQELAYDCDTLKDDYTLLYNFTQETK